MWKLAVEDDQGNRTVLTLVQTEYGLGRGPDNGIRLTERNVSRRHARLVRHEGTWIIDDLASLTGTKLNGNRVTRPEPLTSGDLIQVGDYRLAIGDEAADLDPTSLKETVRVGKHLTSAPPTHDRLVVLVGPNPGSEFRLGREPIVVGRGEECEICLLHASVSRTHAELRPMGDGRYEVVDLESANGLRVNGVELKRALLDNHDRVELGDVVITFVTAGDDYRPPAPDLRRLTTVPPSGGWKRVVPMLVGLGGLLAAGTALIVWGLSTQPAAPVPSVAAGAASTQPSPLERAWEASATDPRGAFERLRNQLSAESPWKQRPLYRRLEQRWADELLRLAKAAPGREEKIRLLEEIAATPTVDATRRQVAEAALDQLQLPLELPSPATSAEPDDGAAPARAPSEPTGRGQTPPAAPAKPLEPDATAPSDGSQGSELVREPPM